MKYSKIFLSLFLILGLAVIFSCEDSNENPVKDRGVYVVPSMEFTSAPVFTTDLAASYVDFTVSLNKGETADGGKVEVLYNGEKATVVEEFSSFPANIHLEASEVISKMGLNASAIQTSDVFSVFILTVKNGVATRSVASANIKIVCAFSPNLTQGKYHAVSEKWGAEGDVVLTADANDPYKIYVAGLEDLDGVSGGKDVYFQINSGSYTIDNKDAFVMSPDLEIDWGGKYAGYKDYSYEIVNGSYNSCNGTYTLTFKIFCTLGSFGNYDFVFTPAE